MTKHSIIKGPTSVADKLLQLHVKEVPEQKLPRVMTSMEINDSLLPQGEDCH